MTIGDLQATILHLLGLNAHKVSLKYQGHQRLIGPTDAPRVHQTLLA